MARLRNETGYVLNVEMLGLKVTPGEEFDGPVDQDGGHIHVPGCVLVEVPAGDPPAKTGKAKAGKAGEDPQ